MGDVAVRLAGISKRYRLGPKQPSYGTLRDTLTRVAGAPWRWAARMAGGSRAAAAERREIIWALQDVSCEIQRGELVGIIGRNGSGKSTFLKILSRITPPTRGCAEIRGRVGSLLEVGTGFHPELTGRENIFLNGAILGMRKTEIRAKFDEIVAFAEVERFIDTPVKHYSSGMYLRLAFAVAAHLEPEILLVDEVLAVGDARFQKKCLAKMGEVGQAGRTVLFVSHSMPAVTRLCQRVLLLDEGRLVADGPAHRVVNAYLSSGVGTTAMRVWEDPAKAPRGEAARILAVRVCTEDGTVTDAVDIRRPVTIEVDYEVLKPGFPMFVHYQFVNEEGLHVFSAHELDTRWRRRPRPVGIWTTRAQIPGNLLSEGTLFVGVGVHTLEPDRSEFYVPEAVAFSVIDSLDGDSARGDWAGHMGGVIRPLLDWQTTWHGAEAATGS